mmetsp:Transcript_35363/g.113922  ORF Transcript_35363/g.113922 Transcript_35363/m.113922 type:complete len:211 (+) Transcript_35363:467-1099(+)
MNEQERPTTSTHVEPAAITDRRGTCGALPGVLCPFVRQHVPIMHLLCSTSSHLPVRALPAGASLLSFPSQQSETHVEPPQRTGLTLRLRLQRTCSKISCCACRLRPSLALTVRKFGRSLCHASCGARLALERPLFLRTSTSLRIGLTLGLPCLTLGSRPLQDIRCRRLGRRTRRSRSRVCQFRWRCWWCSGWCLDCQRAAWTMARRHHDG